MILYYPSPLDRCGIKYAYIIINFNLHKIYHNWRNMKAYNQHTMQICTNKIIRDSNDCNQKRKKLLKLAQIHKAFSSYNSI